MSQEVDPTLIRQISLTKKKEIMWNVIQPGDPYDIRKSMIAKLPGQRNFMGSHLELICLLQAAEIERLSICLEEHRLKLREQQRVSLDRHSYEVQIKELSEKLQVDDSLRNENSKLKDFIRRQSKQLQQIQRSQDFSLLNKKYEDSLNQIQQLVKQNKNFELTLTRLKGELEINQQELKVSKQSKIRESAVIESTFKKDLLIYEDRLNEKQKKFAQYQQQTKQKIQQHMNTLKEYQNRFYLLAEEIERLNSCLREKSKEINQQHVKNQQLIDQKRYIEEQKNQGELKNKGLVSEVTSLQRQIRQIRKEKSSYEQRELVIQEYESRIERLSIQIDRLNSVLRKKVNELQEYRRRIRDQELTLSNYQLVEKQTDELRAKFSEISKKIFEYQKQHTVQVQEIDRLNITLKKMIGQINEAEVKLKSSEKQLTTQIQKCVILETDRDQLTRTHNQLAQTNNELIAQLKSQNEHLQTKMINFQRIYQENNVLRAEMEQLSEEKKSLSFKLKQQDQDLQVLRELNAQGEQNKEKEEELLKLKNEYQMIEIDKVKLQQELDRLRMDYDDLVIEKEENKKKLEQLGEYYKKILIFSEQISRLNSILAGKQDQILQYHQNLVNYQEKIKYFEENINLITTELQNCRKEPEEKIRQHVNKIQALENQLGRSREKDEQIISYQGKLTVIGQEIERLNKILKNKIQQIEHLEEEKNLLKEQLQDFSLKCKQIQELQNRLIDQSNEMERLSYLVKQKEESISRLNEEVIRTQKASIGQMSLLTEKIITYEGNIQRLKNQIDRLNDVLSTNSNQIFSIEQKDRNYLSEIQRLNNLLRIKVEQSEDKAHQYKKYSEEIQYLKDTLNMERKDKETISQQKDIFSQEVVKTKQQMHTYQFRIKELYDQFQRLQTVMKALKEQNESISQLKSELHDLIEKNHWLGTEIERLNVINQSQGDELKEIRSSMANGSSLERRVKQDLSLMVILFAEVESLRVQVLQRERQVGDLRKLITKQYRV